MNHNGEHVHWALWPLLKVAAFIGEVAFQADCAIDAIIEAFRR